MLSDPALTKDLLYLCSITSNERHSLENGWCLTMEPQQQIVRDDTTNGVDVNRARAAYSS